MNEIITRPARPADVPALVVLWQRFMREGPDVVPHADPAAAFSHWTERLRSQIAKSHVVVVEIDDTPAGFAGFIDSSEREWVPESVAYVVDLYVTPEARASRAATLLFEHLLSNTLKDYKEVWTNTSVQNRRVQILLSRAGFTPLENFEIVGLKEQLYFRRKSKTTQPPERYGKTLPVAGRTNEQKG